MNNLFIIYRFIHKMFACIVMVTFVPVRRYAGHHSTGGHHEQETRRQNCACYGRFSGIGLATAKRFVAEGAHVYITGRSKAGLEAAAREIGSGVTAVQADASKP